MAKILRFHKGKPAIKPSHKGLLHEDTNTPAGEKIPPSKIMAAEHSRNPKIRKRSVFAANAAKWG